MGRQSGVSGSDSGDLGQLHRDPSARETRPGAHPDKPGSRSCGADAGTDAVGEADPDGHASGGAASPATASAGSNIFDFPNSKRPPEQVRDAQPAGLDYGADPAPVEPAKTPSDKASASDHLAQQVASHPITKALSPLSDPNNPLNPARIIADSLPPARPAPAGFAPSEPGGVDESGRVMDEFWSLWLTHHDQMRAQCIRLMSGNIADAEDALSHAMLRASQKFPRYADDIMNKKAWLGRLVYNVCMDHYRQKGQVECGVTEQDIDANSAEPLFTERQQSPEKLALSKELIRELSRAIDTL